MFIWLWFPFIIHVSVFLCLSLHAFATKLGTTAKNELVWLNLAYLHDELHVNECAGSFINNLPYLFFECLLYRSVHNIEQIPVVAPPWTSGSGASWHWDVGSGSFGFCGLHSGVSMDPADVQSDCVFVLIKPCSYIHCPVWGGCCHQGVL